MKIFLTGVCCLVLAVMLYVTISASLHQDIISATRQLWPDPWFRATLADAYFGFLFFWLWVSWREQSVAISILWFLLIMTLGNLAMAGYLLLQLRHLRSGENLDGLFIRKESP
jgi:ABC-type maltose transport system permease subunit